MLALRARRDGLVQSALPQGPHCAPASGWRPGPSPLRAVPVYEPHEGSTRPVWSPLGPVPSVTEHRAGDRVGT